MGKTTESRHILRLSETKMVLDILKNPNFHDQLLADLNNKKHLIHNLCTHEPVKRLQAFLKQQLKNEIALLETYFSQDEGKQSVTESQKTQCDTRLKKLLEIIKLLYKNDDFYNDEDKNLPLFNQLMTLVDDYEVITKLISLLMNTSFQKTEKQFFYHIYFLCDHVDIHDLKDSGIKQVYEIGKRIKGFKFFFIQQKEQKQIIIDDFYKFIWENNLAQSHYRKVTNFLLQKHQLSMEKGSMNHLALLSKVKLYLKGVKFNNDGTVVNNGNSIVQAVAYANAMYCYIEYFVLGQEVTEYCSIPNIFSFPPAYSEIFKELLEIFFLEGSNKDTHLTILKCINEILELQQRTSAIDIVGRLNDNSSLIYKYLNYVKNSLESNESIGVKGKFNIQGFQMNEFILQLFRIMSIQIQETHELNNIAYWIVEKIFKKETSFTYNDEVINEAGDLLVSIEYEQEKLMKVVIEKIETHPDQSKPYLKVLNDLFSKKYTRMVQRRDLTYIARESSESCILVKMEELIKQEVENKASQRDSFLMETIQLVSNVCEESPTLLDSIQKTNSNLIPYLLDLISAGIYVPADINSLTDVINFLHHISLKDGPIRNELLERPMSLFIVNFLTMDRYVQTLSRNVKAIGGYIVGSLNRFIGNIKSCSKYIFNAFIQAAHLINQEYKKYSLLEEIQNYDLTQQGALIEQRLQIESSKILKIIRCDSKLINLLKIIEKTSSMILKKFKSRSLHMLLRPLLEINFQRDNVLLDGSLELSLLKAIINETIIAIKSYNQMVERKEKRRRNQLSSNQMMLDRIEEQEDQSGEHSQQVQPIQEEQNEQNQRLATQNNEIPDQNQENQNPQQPAQVQPNQPLQNSSASNDEGINLFMRQQSQESSPDSEYEQIQDENNQPEKKENSMQDEKKDSIVYKQEQYFTQLTEKMTKEFLQSQQTMSEQLIKKLYFCFENLDKFIIPILENQEAKQAVLKQMTEFSVYEEVERQQVQTILKSQFCSQNFSFNAVNLSITIYSSNLQRLFKFMQLTLNMDNESFNHAEFQNVIKRFDKYLRFYLELAAQSYSKHMFEFIKNQEVKYSETSKLPKSRVQNKSIDVQNLKKNLQNQLNQRWTLFNALYDTFLRLVSGSLNGASGKAFIILPQFQEYFLLIKQTILENVQNYLLTKILPILKTDIGVRDFQRYRQSIKVIMEFFGLNELKSTIEKTDSNILITLYLYYFDPSKQKLLSTLGQILAEQEQRNDEQESFMLDDTAQNRWKLIKRIFLKMNYYKIKIFLSKAYSADPENDFNHSDHPDYEKQLKKSYFIHSGIHELFCTFIEKVIFSQKKNGYLRDILLFSSSQLALFSKRIIKHPQTIFVNFIFSENQQKQLTKSEFYSKINERNSKMLSLILGKLDSSVLYYLPMILEAVLTVQRPKDQKILGKYNEKIKQMFYDVSKSINQIHLNLTGKNMSLGFSLPRKSSGFVQKIHHNRENGQAKMEEQIEEELDLKRQVLKFNNLVALVIEFIKIFTANCFFEEGHPKISINYVKSVVDFGTYLFSNFEVETHFPQQGDQLAISMIRMIEEFNSYRVVKDEFIKKKKTQRQKERHSTNKKKFKHLKKRGKQFDKDSISNSNQLEEFSVSQNIPPKKSKKGNKKSQKQLKRSTKSPFKPSKRDKSQISSRQGKQTTKDKRNKAKEQHHGSFQNETSLKGSILNRSMTDFLKICLTASQSKPYLTARTTQLLINFLQKFSKDVVIRSQSEIQNIKNGKKLEKFKNKFFVFGSQIFGDLLEVKLRNQKHDGFFYLITYLGMKLMTEPHAKVDFQSAIKRYFYEQQIKFENNLSKNSSKLVSLKEFENFLEKARIKEIFDFSYLLSFVEIKQKDSDNKDIKAQLIKHIQKSNLFKKESEKSTYHCGLCTKKFSGIQFLAKHIILKHPQFKRRVFLSQNDQNLIQEVHQFTSKNYKKFTDPNQVSQVYVKLKNSQQLDVISLPSIKRKKPAHNQDLNKKVRFFEYHPEGDFAALVCQIINNIIKIILSQIVETLSSTEIQEDPFLKPFNLKILLYNLQIFCRQSPTIVPWIVRFKCKKILLAELKKHKLSSESLAYKKIVSYVYGTEDIQMQNFQEVSFLTLLIKFIYPVSQISTFIFELCLDNNVLMKDKSDKSKDTKEQNDNDVRKCVPFGSIIRQKIICEIENELALNKTLDEEYIRKGLNTKQNCMVMKKIGSMGLLTILMSVRQFAKLCIEGNLMKKIQEEYLRTSKIVRQLCRSKNQEELSLGSNVMRNFLINYFLKPMEMLQQLSIQYHIAKRQNTIFKRIWTNGDRVHIRFLLTSESINDQLFGDEIFFKSNFKSTWFYANNLEGDEPLDFERNFDEDDSMEEDSSDNDSNGNIWDEEDSEPPLDQQIEQQSERSLSMQGREMVSDDEGQDEPQEWYGSEDPFDRESNTFENFILYPDDDYLMDNRQEEENEQEIQQSEEQGMSIQDESQLDSYDDSEEQGLSEGLQIDLSPEDNLLFPIDQDSVSAIQFPFKEHQEFYSEGSLTVPDVGIYHYYIPDEPERRDHPNHQCHNSSKPQIKLLQTLYEIFMDVVSFEDIKITNKMVKLQNQQAKLIRKIFKIASFRIYQQKFLTNSENKSPIHNLHILELQNEYYDQIYQIFSIDSIFFVSEKIDFKHCQRIAYFLQSFPIHYTDLYMSEPEIYFNEFTKTLRRRRGMFMNPTMVERMRRAEDAESSFSPFRSRFARPRSAVPRNPRERVHNFANQSDEYIQNNNVQSPSEQLPVVQQQPQENQQINLIEFNVENPNGGVINVSTNLAEILQNMGMSERQFFSLPHDAQSDIIQNSLQSQLQNGEGNLNPFLGRIFGNEAPNVSPVMQPHPLLENEQNSEQVNQQNSESSDEIQMPEQFEMEEQQNEEDQEDHEQMQEENSLMDDTPIDFINRNQNEVNETPNAENDAFLERYREISLKHSQKISKDVIEILNKDHKNDSKFPEISEELLEEILETIFVLENKDFSHFPESFLTLNMINSKSCSKVLSSLLTLLSLYPSDSQLSEMIEDNKFGKELIKSKISKKDLIPKLSLKTYLYEISKDYENEIYPNMAIKILHILETITSHYSISMQMLSTNNNPLKVLEKYSVFQTKEETYLSSFETLIRLLASKTIKKSPIMVDQILKITNNIVKHYFEKNIFSIHQQQKQLKEPKKNILEENSVKINAQSKEQISILPVSMEKQEPAMKQIHKAIELSELSIELLSSLLMSDDLSEGKNLSELIMKLSINGKNLILFLKNIETVLSKLCEKCIAFLNKEKKSMDKQEKLRNNNEEVEESELDDLKKFFCLLEIFSSMIKEFKQFAYRHHIDRYDFIMDKFKGIIESKSLFKLCEEIASIISNTGESNDFIKNSAEIFEIFFVIFNINIELATKLTQEDQNLAEQKESNRIATLGEVSQRQNGQVAKSEHLIMMAGQPLIQNAAFNKLWNEKVCSPNGRILLNSMIKRKLFTSLKRKKEFSSMSLFDIPMIKIILNTPHMLDFDNKRALFRAEMKRLKKKFGNERIIYMSLDRKEVFQQSFNIIMDKKPQDLKNRVKIDFEGEEGEDAGGLTREWYHLLSKEIFNPDYGLFRPSSTGTTYQPSSTSYVNSEHLNYFKFIGRLMGKALFDGFMFDAYFTPAFYKHILKIPITYLDMQEEDFEYFNSLKWILNNSPIEQYMEMDFTYEFDNFGEIKTKELIPNGANVQVTEENKWKYVQLICYAKMATAIQAQLEKFLQGLHQIVPHKYLKIFDPKELQMMISGLPTIDINDLKRNTMLNNYLKTDQVIIWLFELLESFDMSLRTSFLQFVTGTSKVPPEGFKGLMGVNGPQKFTIQKEFDIKKLPRAHTCFNQLDLPNYPTKEMLMQKLTYAITQGKQGFGIV